MVAPVSSTLGFCYLNYILHCLLPLCYKLEGRGIESR
jgi:hypothetical protein